MRADIPGMRPDAGLGSQGLPDQPQLSVTPSDEVGGVGKRFFLFSFLKYCENYTIYCIQQRNSACHEKGITYVTDSTVANESWPGQKKFSTFLKLWR